MALKPDSAASPDEQSGDRDAVTIALEELRALIVTGALAPGSELSQVGLARRLGVSTTPLREALRQLEAEGLVESRRNRSPRIAPFDPQDLVSVYSQRILLESFAIAISAPLLEEADISGLDACLAEMRAWGDATDFLRWEEAHLAFHAGLVAHAATQLQGQLATLSARSDRYRRMSVLGQQPSAWSIGEAEHQAILEAAAHARAGEAAALLARHLSRSALTVLAHLAPDADSGGIRLALEIVTGWAGSAPQASQRRSSL
ncbi:MAG TPA: GntR family transcriptional regulator [Solirubrobacteraceae bacterium]|nr:GntR family transcriptional regulator [Solirubrobacteraceae bacterium]